MFWQWNFLLRNALLSREPLRETVCEILEKVTDKVDRAVISYESSSIK